MQLAHLHNAAQMITTSSALHQHGIIDWHLEADDVNGEITPQQKTELQFLQDLLNAGFMPQQLPKILEGLEKPYLYSTKQIYYHFGKQRWERFTTATTKQSTEDPLNYHHTTESVDQVVLYNNFTHYTISPPPHDFHGQEIFLSDRQRAEFPDYCTITPVIPQPHKRIRRLRFGEVFWVG
jgi:hypothetical protein